MADGRAFEVGHPDFVAQSPSGRTVIVFQQDDSYSILDLLFNAGPEAPRYIWAQL